MGETEKGKMVRERREQGWSSEELQILFEGVGEDRCGCDLEICGWAIQGGLGEEVAAHAEWQSLKGHGHLRPLWHWGQSINTA